MYWFVGWVFIIQSRLGLVGRILAPYGRKTVLLTGTSPASYWVLGPITLNIFKHVFTAGAHWNFIKTSNGPTAENSSQQHWRMTEIGSKCRFSTIISKGIHRIQSKLMVYTCWMGVQNWFAFGPRWSNFSPLVATNDWKGWFPTIIWKIIHAIQFILGVHAYCVSVQNSFAYGPRWPNFGHLVATKWLNVVVYDHYLKKYSPNSFKTWCVHLLSDCSELIRLWATLAKFWSSNGHKRLGVG